MWARVILSLLSLDFDVFLSVDLLWCTQCTQHVSQYASSSLSTFATLIVVSIVVLQLFFISTHFPLSPFFTYFASHRSPHVFFILPAVRDSHYNPFPLIPLLSSMLDFCLFELHYRHQHRHHYHQQLSLRIVICGLIAKSRIMKIVFFHVEKTIEWFKLHALIANYLFWMIFNIMHF